MTDRELNEAVAAKLGQPDKDSPAHQFTHGHSVGISGDCMSGCGKVDGVGYKVPDYCHSIKAAWEITEHPGYLWRIIQIEEGRWKVKMYWITPEIMYETEADTAPMAICKAFLKLEG